MVLFSWVGPSYCFIVLKKMCINKIVTGFFMKVSAAVSKASIRPAWKMLEDNYQKFYFIKNISLLMWYIVFESSAKICMTIKNLQNISFDSGLLSRYIFTSHFNILISKDFFNVEIYGKLHSLLLQYYHYVYNRKCTNKFS